ncbi:MAG: hypothetical protein IPH43_14355 [Xanthomonadales bacterium]|nr:hypothetical protein [Xanthomonadales bacterium]
MLDSIRASGNDSASACPGQHDSRRSLSSPAGAGRPRPLRQLRLLVGCTIAPGFECSARFSILSGETQVIDMLRDIGCGWLAPAE